MPRFGNRRPQSEGPGGVGADPGQGRRGEHTERAAADLPTRGAPSWPLRNLGPDHMATRATLTTKTSQTYGRDLPQGTRTPPRACFKDTARCGCGELRQSGNIAKRAQLARGSYGEPNVQSIAN